MAAGDVMFNLASVSDNASLTIRPDEGQEAVIHNIYTGGTSELYYTTGYDQIFLGTLSNANPLLNHALHITRDHYLILKNISGSAVFSGFDGVITLEP